METKNEEKSTKRPIGPPDWEYACQDCQAKFTMPAPKGPSEEKERFCPKCGSKNVKQIGIVKSAVCPPGG